MAKTDCRSKASTEKALPTCIKRCPHCRKTLWSAYVNARGVITLEGCKRLRLHIRRSPNRACSRYHRPYRPEAEGRLVLPEHHFGLEVIALIGALRYPQHRRVPERHQVLVARGVDICERGVTNLLDRYDERVSLRLSDSRRLQALTRKQGKVILALDGLQPDVGYEVLWVLRGSVRIIAGLGTRGQCFQGRERAPQKIDEWHALRHGLEERRRVRTLRYRFRRDSAAYLRELDTLSSATPRKPSFTTGC